MQRNRVLSNRLCHFLIFGVCCILVFPVSGCLIIGAKDGDVRDRVSKMESRLDHLERVYAGASPAQSEQYASAQPAASFSQFEIQPEIPDGVAVSPRIAEGRAGSRIMPN